MAKKELGHVVLQWKCPSCSGLNPGPEKLCLRCGAPQPSDVQFIQPAHEEIITDEAVKEKVKAGPDIHCPYCGARNTGDAKICVSCGGDLSEGARREAGKVMGAHKPGPAALVKCPRCNADNPDTAQVCASCGAPMAQEQAPTPPAAPAAPLKLSPVLIALLVIGALVLGGICIAIVAALTRTETVSATVQSVQWERSIPIEAFGPVQYSDWQDQIPQGADLGSCQEKLRSVQPEPVPNSVEVCGTPYTVDTGTGYGEVRQDCEYQVYDQYCSYTVDEWRQVDSVVASGEGFNAAWPDPSLSSDQRLGQQGHETYTVIFNAGGETYSFETSDYNEYQQFQIGSDWQLKVNSFGGVVSIEK